MKIKVKTHHLLINCRGLRSLVSGFSSVFLALTGSCPITVQQETSYLASASETLRSDCLSQLIAVRSLTVVRSLTANKRLQC